MFSTPLRTPRPVSPNDFELETLEPRLLLSGEFTWVAAAGGDWSNAANWQINGAAAGSAPTAGSAVIIQGLNPGAHVDFASGTASIASLSVTGSLNITGGSMTVTGAGSTIATGSTLSVAGGAFNLTTTGTLTNHGTIAIGAAGVVNVRNGTLESVDAQIQLTSTAALNVERSISSQNPMLWLNSTTAPPAPALSATDSSLITLGAGGTFRVGSSVVISGAAGLVQTGGTIDFKAINNPGAAPAPQNGFIDALASTKAVALDLQAGFIKGTGYASSQNAHFGVTFQPDGNAQGGAQGYLEFGISGTTTFLAGARFDADLFSGFADNSDRLTFSDPLGDGSGTYHYVFTELEVHATPAAGYTPGEEQPQAQVIAINTPVVGNFADVFTGSVTRVNPILGSITALRDQFGTPPYEAQPMVKLGEFDFQRGVFYGARAVRLTEYYVYMGPVGGDWNDPANWLIGEASSDLRGPAGEFSWNTIYASWYFNPPSQAYTAPSFFSNVLIPDQYVLHYLTDNSANSLPAAVTANGFLGSPTLSSGYFFLNSLIVLPYASMTMTGGQLYVQNTVIAGDNTTGLGPIASSVGALNLSGGVFESRTALTIGPLYGTLSQSGGLLENHSTMTFGGASATGGRIVNTTGSTLIFGNTADLSGGLIQLATGSAMQIGQFGTVTVPSLLVPTGATLMAQGALVTPTLTVAGALTTGYSTGSAYNYGTLTLTGDLVMTSTGALTLKIAGFNANEADRVTVSGNVTQAGSFTVALSPFYSISTSGTMYTVLSFGGTLSGSFASTSIASGLSLRTNVAGELRIEAAQDSSQTNALRDNLADLSAYIRNLATYFNLNSITGIGAGTNAPVVANAMADLFGLGAAPAVSGFSLPSFANSGTTTQLFSALTAAGYTMDYVAGGLTVGGTTVADVPYNSGIYAQVRYTADLLTNVGVAAAYAGPRFNQGSLGLLAGLATSNALDGALGWLATLSATVIFGVKTDGSFYVGYQTSLTLVIAGAGTISGAMTVGGRSVTATGTASAGLTVQLLPAGGGGSTGMYDLASLTTTPSSKVSANLDGTASVILTIGVGPLTLSYGATYGTLYFTPSATNTLSATISIPGLVTSGASTPTPVALTGVYNGASNSWTLTGSFTDLRIYGLIASAGSFSVTLSATSFTGTTAMDLALPFIASGGTTMTAALTGSFNASTATLSASATVTNVAIKAETGSLNTMVTAPTATVTAGFAADFGAGTATGSVTLSAAAGGYVPDAKYTATIDDSNGDGAAISLAYSMQTGIYSIAMDRLTFTVSSVFRVVLTGATLVYDRNASPGTNQVLATVSNVSVQLLGLTDVAATGPPTLTTTVTLSQNGISFANASATRSNIRLGDFLDFASLNVSMAGVAFVQGAANAAGSLSFTSALGNMYPDQHALVTTLTGVNASQALSAGSPVWTVHAATFQATAGEAFYVSESNVTLSYDAGYPAILNQSVLTLTNTTIRAQQFSGMGTATKTLAFGTHGVDFGNFSLSGATATIGDYLSFTGVAINATGFQLNYASGSGSTFGGSLQTSFGTIKLFPNASFLHFNPSGLATYYDFVDATSTGAFTIDITTFSLSLGSMLKIEATSVLIRPGQNTILTLGTAKLTSPKLAWLQAEIQNLTVTRTGFTVGTLDLGTVPGEVVTLPGGIATLTGVNFHIVGLGYDTTSGLTGNVSVTVDRLVLFPGDPQFTVVATDLTGGYVTTPTGVSELTFTVGRMQVDLHPDEITFVATNLVITPEASTIVVVGSVTVSIDLGGSILAGSGGNFEIHSDGSLAALPGFGVSFSLSTAPALLRFPGWLQIGLTKIGMSWPDFANDPGNFDLILSAFVTGLNSTPGGLTVTGAINDLRISLSELRAGHMPIIDVGSGAITISGPLFGGTASGSIAIGVMRLDANGDIIEATDTTTPVARRIFYGAVRASFSFASRQGFSLSFGLSELGPINAYMAINANVLLDAASGLTLKTLSAEIDFNSSLPTLTSSTDLNPDNGDLLAFTPVAALTDAQWLGKLQLAVAHQANAPPSGDFWSAFSQTMLIRGSAQFRSANSPESVFRASVDIFISTDGKFLVDGTYTLADTLNVRGRLYADLTDPANATFLFFATYAPAGATELNFQGALQLHITSTVVEFRLTGSVTFKKALVNPKIEGSLVLSYANNELYLRVTGRVNLRFIGDVAGADGIFHLNLADANNPQFWGALNVQTNFSLLENAGIYASGGAYLVVNTTGTAHTETLNIPGTGVTTVNVAAGTLSLWVLGELQVKRGGTSWFLLQGQYGFEITSSRLLVGMSGKLIIGTAASPIVTFDNSGFLQIDDRGIAAQFAISLTPNIPQVAGITINGSFTFQLNTTGVAVSFSTPQGSFFVPAAAANVQGATPGPYAIIYGGGTVTLVNSAAVLTATDLRFVITSTGIVQLNVFGTLALNVNGTTLFAYNASGGFQIDASGVAAALTLSIAANNGGTFGFTAGFSSLVDFQLNTTNQVRTIGSTTLAAGTYARFTADMTLVLGGITLGGRFMITGSPTELTVVLTGGAGGSAAFKVGGTTLLSFGFTAGFSIINENASNRGLVLLGAVTLSTNTTSLGFNIGVGATFTLMLNTTGSTRTLAGTPIAAQTFSVKTTANTTLTLAGVPFATSLEFTANASGVRMQVSGSFALQAAGTQIFQFLIVGAVNIDAAGVSGIVLLTAGAAPPASSDIGITGTFVLEVNTTNQARNFASAPRADGTTAPVTLAAGPYFRVMVGGTVSVLGVTFSGSAAITVTTSFVALQVTSALVVRSGGTTYFTFQANGTLFVNASGVAARFSLGLNAGPAGGFGLSGTNFSLELNTTGTAITLPNSESFLAGTYFRITVTGNLSLPGVGIDGSFVLTVGTNSLSIAATGNVNLAAGGITYFSFSVTGGLVVDGAGLAAVLSLTRQAEFSLLGFTYNLTFSLEVNTTGQARTITLPGGSVALEAGVYGRVRGVGSLDLGGFSVVGNFMFTVPYSQLVVTASATVSVFGVTAGVEGSFQVNQWGLYSYLGLTMSGLSGPGYSLSGTFYLVFNNTAAYNYGPYGSSAPHSYKIAVMGASLQLLGFTFRGSVSLGVSNGAFFIEIPSYDPLQLSFYNFGTVGVSGKIDSNGNFSLTGSLSVSIGSWSTARISGYITVTFSNSGISGSFAGSFYLLGASIASVSGSVSSNAFTVVADIGFTVPGIRLTLNGHLSLTVMSDPIFGAGIIGSFKSYLSGGGRLFGGINVTGSVYINTYFGLCIVSAGFSVSIGGDNLGASLSGTVTISNVTSYNGITMTGRAWGGARVAGVWIGATISVTVHADFSGNASISIDLGVTSVSVPVNLSGIFQSLGSNISGGYAFLDVNGDGVWDPATEARAPVDGDGNFTFNVGDPSVWRVDATNTFGFADLDGNGVWDPATEARVVLVNGALPAAVLPDAPVAPGPLATDPLFQLGLLQAYGIMVDTTGVPNAIGTPEVDPTRGHVVARGGSTVNPATGALTPNTGAVSLGMLTAGYTGLAGAGQVVFFDTNNNAVLDAGEVSVSANNDGFYTFMPGQQQLASLGILAGYDTNHNGIIDANEGSIVLTGGTDKNNGLPLDTITRISAANFGTGLNLAAQPLAALQNILVARGHTAGAANTRLSLVFGLPVGLSLDTVDPRTSPDLSATERATMLRVTSQLETYQLTAVTLLMTAGVSANVAQQAALDALADRVLQNYNPATATLTIAPADMVDFTDLPTLTALLTAAAAKAHVSPVAATTAAVAQVTVELNLRAAAYAASSSDLVRDLARIDAVAKGALKTAIGQLAAGSITPAAFIAQFSGANLTSLLNGVSLVPLTPPTLTGVTDITVPTGAGTATLNLHLGTTTGLASDITLTASSSNPGFLPNTALVIVGSGADRVLAIDSTGLSIGSAIITLTATLNGQVTTQTLVYTLTVPAPQPPVIVTTPTTTVVAGNAYAYNFISFPAISGSAVVVTVSGLPAWLTLTDHGDGTATLLGTPTVADLAGAASASFAISLTATDANGGTATQNFTLVLAESVAVLPSFDTLPAVTTLNPGQSFVYNVHVTPGTGATSVALTTGATLPAWLTFTDHGDGTGTLAGTPGAGNLGAFTVFITATDSNGGVNVQGVGLTVQAPANTLSLSPVGNVTLPAGGTQSITLTLGGLTGAGQLSVATSNGTLLPLNTLVLAGTGATRTLTITPVANQSGSATITLTLSDNGFIVTQSFTVTVTAVDTPVASTGLPLPTVSVPAGSGAIVLNLAGFFTAGAGAVTFTATGSDPALAGVSISGSTLTITPAAGRSGLDLITIVATGHGSATGQLSTASGVIRLTVLPQLTVSAPQVVRTDAGNVMRFTVTLLTPSNQTVRVGYATANGTAVAGVDFVAAAGTLEFSPGVTQRTIDVALIGGLLLNPGNFTLGLAGAENASVGTGTATATVTADRGLLAGIRPPTLELSFTFIEFTGGTSTESADVFISLGGTGAPALTVIRLSGVGSGAAGGALTDLAPGDSLVDATSLGALGALHEIPRY